MIKSSLLQVYTILLLACVSPYANAQLGNEQLASNKPVFSHQYTFLNTSEYYFIDTTFDNLHWYHQFNSAGKDLFEYARLGNMAAPLNPLVVQPDPGLWEYFDLGAYQGYLMPSSKVPFYYTRSALTEAIYRMGYERGESFNLYHTQNINKNWNFLVNYKSLNAVGDYTHNTNKGFSFLANTHYFNEKAGYEAYAYFLNEKLEIDEFGGLANDSNFISNSGTTKPRVLLGINLPSDQRILRTQEVLLKQEYNVLKAFPGDKTDTTLIETAEKSDFLGIGHEFKYQRKSMVYNGNSSSDFYPDYYFENGPYSDSVGYRSFQNTLYLKTEIGTKSKFSLKAGIRNLITRYGTEVYQFTGNNWGLTGNIRGNISDRFYIQGQVDYILLGILNQSLASDGSFNLKLVDNLDLRGGYQFQLKAPMFYEQFYFSNNYIWQNDFDKEGVTTVYAGLTWFGENSITVSNTTFTDRVYFNADAMPEQSSGTVNVLGAELIQNFEFWNLLHQDNRIVYQVSSDKDIIPIPDLVTRNSLYFEFNLFGKALKCLTGAEVKYFSSYNSPSYNPATGVFYNADERMVGNYPFIDFFANFQLRKAKFFIKYEHISEGLNGYDYFAAPTYPLPDRTLRVGISWRFFN